MTANRIREVALYYFSKYGYKGTPLSKIAQEVGIKTPSLYAHFKNKEEIFFSCLTYALENDLRFFQDYLRTKKEMKASRILYSLLIDYENWVSHNSNAMFCLRMLYLPPHYFAEKLIRETNERILKLGRLLSPLFEKAKAQGELTQAVNVEEAVEAYLCLFDGLVIELLYTGSERYYYRLKASWRIFASGLFKGQDHLVQGGVSEGNVQKVKQTF